jgi:hypothetical protein
VARSAAHVGVPRRRETRRRSQLADRARNEVALSGEGVVDAELLVGAERDQRDPILLREPGDELGQGPASPVPAVETRGKRGGDQYPPRPRCRMIVSYVGNRGGHT